MELKALLDNAKTVTGSDKATADALGVPFQHVSDWRYGRRVAQPEDIAILANMTGTNGQAALVEAVLERHAGTKKGELLQRALGKAARGAVAMLIFGVSVAVGGAGLGLNKLFLRRRMRANVYTHKRLERTTATAHS